MTRRLTLKEIEKIRKLYYIDTLSQVRVAKIMKVCQETVLYHVNEQYRKRKRQFAIKRYESLSKKQKKLIYLKRKEYTRKYLKNRYKTDPEFRERHKERVKLSRLNRI